LDHYTLLGGVVRINDAMDLSISWLLTSDYFYLCSTTDIMTSELLKCSCQSFCGAVGVRSSAASDML
jgi:hypothetical protein